MTSPSFMASGLNRRFSLEKWKTKKKWRKPEHCLSFCLFIKGTYVLFLWPLSSLREDLEAKKLQTVVKQKLRWTCFRLTQKISQQIVVSSASYQWKSLRNGENMGMLMEPDELNYSAVIFSEMWCESSRLHHHPIFNVLFLHDQCLWSHPFYIILHKMVEFWCWYSDSSGH